MPPFPHPAGLLGAFADGELRGWRAWWVGEHLLRCPGCVAALRELRLARERLRRAADPAPSAELIERLRALDGDVSGPRGLSRQPGDRPGPVDRPGAGAFAGVLGGPVALVAAGVLLAVAAATLTGLGDRTGPGGLPIGTTASLTTVTAWEWPWGSGSASEPGSVDNDLRP